MQKILILLILSFSLFSFGKAAVSTEETEKNIWIKTYQNYKNYNILINNITLAEQKLKNNNSSTKNKENLKQRISLYKSKLALYETNQSFDDILKQYKYTIPTITLRDFVLKTSLDTIEKMIKKYKVLKNNFYLATASLKNSYTTLQNTNPGDKRVKNLQEDINYFEEYSENIEKTEQNLYEAKEELNKRYEEYKDEVFIKHIFTLASIIIFYIIYKILSTIAFFITHNNKNYEDQKHYKKLLSLLFVLLVVTFVFIRYIDDFIYIITFLSVIAAALTLATREIILNIAGAIYIFFTSIVKVGDRVMVQFETKHTIGDIVDISLIKMKLNEIEDYSNIKEIKSVGRTIYIPNSYIFTKVFYNYSVKKNGLINELLEFEFDITNNFQHIEKITSDILNSMDIEHTITFTLNNSKTGIIEIISYKTNFKESSKIKGHLSIQLLQAYKNDETVKLKSAKPSSNTSSNE